jgi:hypothetical protein
MKYSDGVFANEQVEISPFLQVFQDVFEIIHEQQK